MIQMTLGALCRNDEPVPHSGTATFLRFADDTLELAGIPPDVLASPPELTAAFAASQYGLMLQPSGTVALDFPTDVLSLEDDSAWQEVLLVDVPSQEVSVKLGWELRRDSADGCWRTCSMVWHDFRDK